jgi:hypothetical protein
MSMAWYQNDESPEQIDADLTELRRNMTAEERSALAAYLLEGQEPPKQQPAKREPIPADSATEEQQGQGTGEMSGERAPTGPESARLLAELQASRGQGWQDQEKVKAFLSAKLNGQ